MRRSPHPRLSASASLKRRQRRVPPTLDEPSSEAIGLGLIEAAQRRDRHRDDAGPHPRLSASASLKHRHRAPQDQALRPHPRLSASASLKLPRDRENPHRGAVSSEAIGLGLIEAGCRTQVPSRRTGSSEAIGLGLIEAELAHLHLHTCTCLIRGYRPRPH